MDNLEIVTKIYNILDERKAGEIKVIDVRGLSIMTDYYVIASAGNINHVHALTDHVEEEMHKIGIHFSHMEGYKSGNWILMDYGDFVVNVFDEASRDFYSLDRLWRDGKVIM